MINAEGLRRDVVVIGGSAGGLEAVLEILGSLPANLDATIAIVLHRSPLYESRLPLVLQRRCPLPVLEPADGEPFEPGRVYAAPRDRHMIIDGDEVRLNREPKQHLTRPAIDPLFVSAAKSHGSRVLGVLVSGTGSDGVTGLISIKQAGGVSLVQEPGEARQPMMPSHALADDDVDAALTAGAIGKAIQSLAGGDPVAHGRPPRPLAT